MRERLKKFRLPIQRRAQVAACIQFFSLSKRFNLNFPFGATHYPLFRDIHTFSSCTCCIRYSVACFIIMIPDDVSINSFTSLFFLVAIFILILLPLHPCRLLLSSSWHHWYWNGVMLQYEKMDSRVSCGLNDGCFSVNKRSRFIGTRFVLFSCPWLTLQHHFLFSYTSNTTPT